MKGRHGGNASAVSMRSEVRVAQFADMLMALLGGWLA